MRPAAGIALGGRYRLVRQIAVGGMGEVWVAHDDSLARDVAVKVLREEFAGNSDFLERLRTEARNSAALSHSNIAQLYDYGEQEASGYLVMELVVGEPMSDLLEREPVLPVLRLLSILSQTARALHAAHVAGVVHRDVKPGNILLERTGEVKITDFGVSLAANQVPMTAAGMVMGTAQYLSPEQAIGKAATGASDIYALGIVAYESIVGNRPFTGATPVDIAVAHVNEAVPALPKSIHPGFGDLIMRMLSKDPLDRPRSGAILARNFDLLAEEIAADPWGSGLRRRGNASPPGRRETYSPAPPKEPEVSLAEAGRPGPSHLASSRRDTAARADARPVVKEPPATTRAGQRIAAARSTAQPEAARSDQPRPEAALPPVPPPPPARPEDDARTAHEQRHRRPEPGAPQQRSRPRPQGDQGREGSRTPVATAHPATRATPVAEPVRAATRSSRSDHRDDSRTERRGDGRSPVTRSGSRSGAARQSSTRSASRSQSEHRSTGTGGSTARRTSTTTGQRIGNLGRPTIALALLVLVVLIATMIKAMTGSDEALPSDLGAPVVADGHGISSVQSTIGPPAGGMISHDAVLRPSDAAGPTTPKDA
ncbi:serine/threonine protein kinase [Sanguibacter suaedae]|uniref:non-specific serine/threonine protein kinase n=1 Tax=Sanguibacter suaedae TaxID=2795737 RepID=A0A934I9H9_9MICO|nr:serine/threonine protein kinase [Sanguibacter suaedae]MBI9113841.1 protein kinase [Sanguibacter suaedae]